MTPETAEMVVTSLYVGAGRRAGEAEMTLWANVLDSQPEEGVEEVVRKMLATVDFGLRPPTPALFIEYLTAWRRANNPRPALPSAGDPTPAEDTSAHIAALRATLGGA